jgi:hypothetical protein
MKKLKTKDPRTTRVGGLKPGQYIDGSALDDIQYLECKLILKPDEFTSPKGFKKYEKLVAEAAKECGVGFDASAAKKTRPAIREVLFLDMDDFRLYNNAFILRRRVRFEDGFPVDEPEVVFKFRHPDQQQAAEVDVRPNIPGDYRIKFKAEALPLKDMLGGYRLLFSHNVQFLLSRVPESDRTAMARLAEIFPALKVLKQAKGERGSLVNQTRRSFRIWACWTSARASPPMRTWRCGAREASISHSWASSLFRSSSSAARTCTTRRARCAKFFIRLQQLGAGWIYLGATKTGMVYRLKGNPPQAHE